MKKKLGKWQYCVIVYHPAIDFTSYSWEEAKRRYR